MMHSDRIEEVTRERDELRERVKHLEFLFSAQRKVTFLLMKTAVAILIGPPLVLAFERWIEETKKGSIPTKESAEVAAAIVKRIFRVGLFGILIGLLPVGLLFWQNMLLRNQIEQQQTISMAQIKEQRVSNDLLKEQLQDQLAAHISIQRAQMINTLYEIDCTGAREKLLHLSTQERQTLLA